MSQLLQLLAALAVVIGIGYIIRRPQWAVVVILVMFPLEQALQGYFPALAANSKITNASVGVLALFAIGMRFLRGERLFSGVMNPVTIGVFGLYVLTWVGLLWTPSDRSLELLTYGVPYVVLLLFATQLLVDDIADFHRLAVGVMLVGSVIALLVMFNPATTFEGGRLTLDIGLYSGEQSSNPLALATMGGLMAVLAALVQFERPHPFYLVLRLTAFATGLGLAIQSGSRGQVVAAVVVGVAFYPLARRVASVGQFFLSAVGYGFLFLALYGVFSVFIGDWNRKRWDVGSALDVTDGRLANVVDFLGAFGSEPGMWFFGLGPMAFQPATGSPLEYVHNQPVEVLCELGVVGLCLYVIVAFSVARAGLWLWRFYGNDPVKRSATATLCGLVAYSFIISLKQGSLTTSGPLGMMWWVVLARIATHERRLHQHEPYSGEYEYEDYGDDGGEYTVVPYG